MPRGDGTGPQGMGSMTGRAAGYCAGYHVPGFANPISGRGFRGIGRGFHRARFGGAQHAVPIGAQPYIPCTTPEQELDYLKNQADNFQNALKDINKRIEELQQDSKTE